MGQRLGIAHEVDDHPFGLPGEGALSQPITHGNLLRAILHTHKVCRETGRFPLLVGVEYLLAVRNDDADFVHMVGREHPTPVLEGPDQNALGMQGLERSHAEHDVHDDLLLFC